MIYYDVSRPLDSHTAVYKDKEEKKVQIQAVAVHPQQGYHESQFCMNLHTGTHVDAPLHMIDQAETMEAYGMEHFLGRCQVLDLGHVETCIQPSDLAPYDLSAAPILLLKTRNSQVEDWDPQFVYLSAEAAEAIRAAGVITVGIDAMSVERGLPDHPAHHVLLGAKIAIIEDLRLAEIEEGFWYLSALPLALRTCEAAPCRAVMWQDASAFGELTGSSEQLG